MGVNLKCRLRQLNEDLKSIRDAFQAQNEENSRQIESLLTSESSIYEPEVNSYTRNTARLQKANAILVNEVKSLLNLCYVDRMIQLGEGESVRLSTEVLTILQNCINKVIKTSPDKFVTLTPEQANSEAVQLLLTANLIQKDKTDMCKFRIVDFYSWKQCRGVCWKWTHFFFVWMNPEENSEGIQPAEQAAPLQEEKQAVETHT